MEHATMKIMCLSATMMAATAAEIAVSRTATTKHFIMNHVRLSAAAFMDIIVYSQIRAVSTVTKLEVFAVVRINAY
jgi:hypothetical protein